MHVVGEKHMSFWSKNLKRRDYLRLRHRFKHTNKINFKEVEYEVADIYQVHDRRGLCKNNKKFSCFIEAKKILELHGSHL
jgi:hypothetical protein